MLNALIKQASTLLANRQATNEELHAVENELSAYLEALATERVKDVVDFDELEDAQRLLKELRRERNRRLTDIDFDQPKQEKHTKTATGASPKRDRADNEKPAPADDQSPDLLKKYFRSNHDADAENLMDQAEEAFYAGNYAKAIALYEKVLQVEPAWSRAREHHDEAEDFLRSGNIPSVALPPDAGKAYGKAQSAARVFRYQVALNYLDEAFKGLQEAGIQRWREGEELRQDLENQMQAYEVYQEGLAILRTGDLHGGLAKVQAAVNAVALPEYIQKANEVKADLSALDEVGDVINTQAQVPPERLADARSKLERLNIKYGDVPQVNRLLNRMALILPAAIKSLVEKTRRLCNTARTAPTIQEAKQMINEARENTGIIRLLDGNDPACAQMENEISDTSVEIDQLENAIQRAHLALKSGSPIFPRDALKISDGVRKRFAGDPEVIQLKKEMRPYLIRMAGAGLIILLALTGIIWGLARTITSNIAARNLALTPTITQTPTITLTPTETLVPTATYTITPLYTATDIPTLTPTPVMMASANRTVWARNGCYEGFKANGRIPEGSIVTLIAMPERMFDEFNRECVLIELRSDSLNVLGYVLMMDLSLKP